MSEQYLSFEKEIPRLPEDVHINWKEQVKTLAKNNLFINDLFQFMTTNESKPWNKEIEILSSHLEKMLPMIDDTYVRHFFVDWVQRTWKNRKSSAAPVKAPTSLQESIRLAQQMIAESQQIVINIKKQIGGYRTKKTVQQRKKKIRSFS